MGGHCAESTTVSNPCGNEPQREWPLFSVRALLELQYVSRFLMKGSLHPLRVYFPIAALTSLFSHERYGCPTQGALLQAKGFTAIIIKEVGSPT